MSTLMSVVCFPFCFNKVLVHRDYPLQVMASQWETIPHNNNKGLFRLAHLLLSLCLSLTFFKCFNGLYLMTLFMKYESNWKDVCNEFYSSVTELEKY